MLIEKLDIEEWEEGKVGNEKMHFMWRMDSILDILDKNSWHDEKIQALMKNYSIF